jgi:outer membrane lipoprotein-sorting protein
MTRLLTAAFLVSFLLDGAAERSIGPSPQGSAAPPVPDALALARRTDNALRGRTQHTRASLTVRTPDWQRTLELETWFENPGRTFIRVTAPAKEAGTATLRLGTDMWNYLPQVERVIKVPPSLMLEAWMGSDFSNDDLVKETSLVDDYTHRIEGERVVSGDRCYQLIATPKPGAPVVWGRLVVWVRTSDAVPREEDYYDERGALRKTLAFDDVRDAGDRQYPMRWTMTSVTKPGHESILTLHSVALDRPILDRIFTLQNLKRVY